MLANRSRCFLAALAWILIAGVAGAQTVADNANQASFTSPAANAAAMAGRIAMIPGDTYTLRVVRQGIGDRFKGELVKENAQWIVLRSVSTRPKQEATSPLSAWTGIGQKPRTESVGTTEEFLWIPRDAATVENHTQAAQRGPQPVVGESPPEHAGCSIQLVRGGKPLKRQGGIESVSEKSITMSAPKKVKLPNTVPTSPAALLTANAMKINRSETRYVRETLARHDILCVHITNFDAAAFEEAP